MNYFPTSFLDHLARHDSRFRPDPNFETDVLVLEEKSLNFLLSCNVRPLHLILLTEQKDIIPHVGKHVVERSVYKYNEVRHLIADIFDQPHEVRFFLFPEGSDDYNQLITDKVICSPLISHLQPLFYTETLLDDSKFLEYGTHFLYHSPLDVIDPPHELIMDIIRKQSRKDSLDVVAHGFHGVLVKSIMQVSDVIYIIAHPKYLSFWKIISMKYPNVIFIDNTNLPEEYYKFKKRRGDLELSTDM